MRTEQRVRGHRGLSTWVAPWVVAGAVLALGLVACGGGAAPPPTTTVPAVDCTTVTAAGCQPTVPASPPGTVPPSDGIAAATPAQAATKFPEAASSATPVVYRSEVAEVGPVVWANAVDPQSKMPMSPAETLPPETPTIYAALPLARLAAGTQVQATWTYNGTPLEGFVSTVTVDRDEQNLWAEFHLTLTGRDRWPTGTYAIEVRVNGDLAQRSAVTVATNAG